MFFILSKVLWFIMNPINIIFLSFLLGWLLLFKNPHAGKKVIGFGLVLLCICGLGFIPFFLTSLLENRIPAGQIPDRIDGIIVLTGVVNMTVSRAGLIELTEQADRIIEGIILAGRHPEARLIITGGTSSLSQEQRFREADYLKRLTLSLGIDEKSILIERNSRSTHEHAVEMAKVLPKDGEWVLVTSAFHMPRSFGCFKKEGLKVIPYPVDYKTNSDIFSDLSLIWFMPTLGSLDSFNTALHEWFGLIAYRLAGYTESFFPCL